MILEAAWTIWRVTQRMVLKTQHAVVVMSDSHLINLSLAFSHLKLNPVLVDSSNRR